MTTMPGPADGREPEACAQLDPGLFFPISSAGPAREYIAMAQGDLRRGRRPEPLRVVSLLAGGLAGQGTGARLLTSCSGRGPGFGEFFQAETLGLGQERDRDEQTRQREAAMALVRPKPMAGSSAVSA
ncbi:MAG TPA: hypothetical protein VKH61_12745 [Streptosporangiaceae bacterium]|nr:hypothetical protein [Streptosporangiaceae bacterium]